MTQTPNTSAHAEMGPSAADRWMLCTASVELIRRLKRSGEIPARESSVFAAEGTVAHQIREDALNLGMDAYAFVGQKITADGFSFGVTEEMADCVQPGVDWIRETLVDFDVEIRVKLNPWLPGQFGTMDTGGIVGDMLIVDDYKHGAGEAVSAVGNRQMRLYALGYWHFLGRPNIKSVLMVIDQPRAGGMKFWEISLEELLDFAREASDAYLRIKTGKTEFKPDVKGCRWCPVRRTREGCPAYNRMMKEIFADAFADEYFDLTGGPWFTDPDLLTPEKRARVALFASDAKSWIEKVSADSLAQAVEGDPDPGTKAVIGRAGKRFFPDEGRAQGVLFDAVGMDAYKPLQMLSITEIEKLLKPGRRKPGHPEAWRALRELMDQKPGSPILTREDDPRETFKPLADEFEDL